jgi:hypothetical protein
MVLQQSNKATKPAKLCSFVPLLFNKPKPAPPQPAPTLPHPQTSARSSERQFAPSSPV